MMKFIIEKEKHFVQTAQQIHVIFTVAYVMTVFVNSIIVSLI